MLQSTIAALSELPARPAEASHYFFSGTESQSISSMLAKPHRHFIEMREYVQLGRVLEFVRREYPHISLSLTTQTAFKQPVAEFFTAHLARQRSMSQDLKDNVRTCLQEAVLNAIIHGNLDIGHEQPSQFSHYLEKISRSVQDNALGLKRVSIFCWLTDHHITICVADQGSGFDIRTQPEEGDEVPYGRGLRLIRRLASRTWHTEPNHLYMQFNRHA